MSLLDDYLGEIKSLLLNRGMSKQIYVEFESNFWEEFNDFMGDREGINREEIMKLFIDQKEPVEVIINSLISDSTNQDPIRTTTFTKSSIIKSQFSFFYPFQVFFFYFLIFLIQFFIFIDSMFPTQLFLLFAISFPILHPLYSIYTFKKRPFYRSEFLLPIYLFKLVFSSTLLLLFLYFYQSIYNLYQFLIVDNSNQRSLNYIVSIVLILSIGIILASVYILYHKPVLSHFGDDSPTFSNDVFVLEYWYKPIKLVLSYFLLILTVTYIFFFFVTIYPNFSYDYTNFHYIVLIEEILDSNYSLEIVFMFFIQFMWFLGFMIPLLDILIQKLINREKTISNILFKEYNRIIAYFLIYFALFFWIMIGTNYMLINWQGNSTLVGIFQIIIPILILLIILLIFTSRIFINRLKILIIFGLTLITNIILMMIILPLSISLYDHLL